MLKALAIIGIGAAAGAMLTYQLSGRSDSDLTDGLRSAALAVSSAVSSQQAEDLAPDVGNQLETLQAAQRRTSPTDIISALEGLQRESWSANRALEADALLMRLAEISPALAVETSVRLELEPHLVAQAFLTLAELDIDAALAELESLGNPESRNLVAMALLDITGDDVQGLERVAAALPGAAADQFRIEWLTHRVKSNPYDAFSIASSMPRESLRQRAIAAVGTAWAAVDPRGALQQADSLPLSTAQSYRLAVSREWARLNASEFLNHVETAAVVPEEFIVALRSVAASDPELVLRIAERVSGPMSDSLRATAIGELANTDFHAAETLALAMSPGQARTQALAAIGGALAREDPRAALEWAQEVAPSAINVMQTVFMNIVGSDIDMALELIDDPLPGLEPALLLSVFSSRVVQHPEKVAEVANTFLERDDLQSQGALSNLVSNWMRNEPETALEWVLANTATLDSRIVSAAASSLANASVETAVTYIDRIPQQHRAAWITQVAGQYGRTEPGAAINWIAGHQGQPYYETALRQVLQSAAQTDPRSAARQVSQASDAVQLGAAQQVASSWAQREPRAAVEWAAELSNEEARSQAVSTAIGAWANSDPVGATNWVFSQPRGESRDQPLENLVRRGASSGTVDQRLLEGFSSDRAKQQALMSAIPMLARTDAARARELMEEHITDANMRQQVERMLQQ